MTKKTAMQKNKGKTNLEIERKFLLRRMPSEFLSKRKPEIINIEQYYFLIDGIWQRFRISNSSNKGIRYIHTIKESLKPGVYKEYEDEVTKDEFMKLYNIHYKKSAHISKIRYVVKSKGLKFEIDVYENLSLVVLEVELPKMSFKFDFPKGLGEEIIMELTGMKQFSNFSLASNNGSK